MVYAGKCDDTLLSNPVFVKKIAHSHFGISDVTFDRLAGFDEETAWEMGKVRSAGYTVTQDGKPITIYKQPS